MPKLFTDQQTELTLKRAAERRATGGEPTHSLESMQDIARQVGIDPALVADAAATIDRSGTGVSALLGAPSAYRASRRLAGASPTMDLGAVLKTIRHHLPVAGEFRHVRGGIEWHAGPADNKTVVALSPRAGGGVDLRIDARQQGPKALAYLAAGTLGLIASAVSIVRLHGPGVAVGVAAIAVSFAVARMLWNHVAKRRDKRLLDLGNALAGQIDGKALGS
jgi:hypothetical protein